MKNPLLSIIVPIYNSSNYIERCARSLLKQTLENIEYIFIDDCSTDNSVDILEAILKEFPNKNVKFLKMEQNSGQAAVRKLGVEIANGTYIGHCDSDDWVEITMYEKLLNEAIKKNLDLVWCDFFVSNGQNHLIRSQNCDTNKIKLLKKYLTGISSGFMASLWNKIYKKDLHDLDFIFPSESMTEDFVIVTQLILKAKEIGYCNMPLYYYCLNQNSDCHTFNEHRLLKNYRGMYENTEMIIKILKKYSLLNELYMEIISKKFMCKEILLPICHKKQYRKLWLTTYSEINNKIYSNPYISFNSKVRTFCLKNNLSLMFVLLRKINAILYKI